MQQYNPFSQIQGMMSNPTGSMLDMAKERLRTQNPELYRKAEEMTKGKSPDQLRQTAINLARENGIDLQQFARQFGVNL